MSIGGGSTVLVSNGLTSEALVKILKDFYLSLLLLFIYFILFFYYYYFFFLLLVLFCILFLA